MSENWLCCFDYSHNNSLTFESSSFAEFTQFLFGSSYRLGRIQAGFTSIEKLQPYRLVVIGGPHEIAYTTEEINILQEFVKEGGNLLIVHEGGGDYQNNINLSELTNAFGFSFNSDILFDSVDFQGIQTRIIIKDLEPHPLTRNVAAIIQSSACSITIEPNRPNDQHLQLLPIARSGLYSFRSLWDGESWIEEMDAPRSIIAVYSKYYKGKVVGLCTVSMFSSLSSTYGITALNNMQFISNIFNWLIQPPETGKGFSSDEKLINVPLNYNLFLWMEKLVQEKKWINIADVINFAIKSFKDDYVNIMLNVEERWKKLEEERKKQILDLQKIKDRKLREEQTRLLEKESQILSLAGSTIDPTIELQGILTGLQEIDGGKTGKYLNPILSDLPTEKKETPPKTPIESENIPEETSISESECLSVDEAVKIPSEQLKHELQTRDLKPSCDEVSEEKETKIIEEISKTVEERTKKEVVISSDSLSVKAKADQILDEAFKSINSSEEFAKKLKKFKKILD